MKKTLYLLFIVFGLAACKEDVFHADALKIAGAAVCPFYLEVGKNCADIFPLSSERFETPQYAGISFYYAVQKEPLLEVVVNVRDDSSYEINKMDER